jgi:hypothetical protein
VANASSGNIVDVAHKLQRDFDDNEVSIDKLFDNFRQEDHNKGYTQMEYG